MTKTSWAGLIILLSGVVLYGFKMIERMMAHSGPGAGTKVSGHISFMDALGGPGSFEWISSLPAGFMQKWVDSFIHLPLFLVLIGLGALIMIINGIFAKK
ncbi:MAG: hypothetical protein KGY61_09825 [Desulfobacterales bacterium]|nr:hypothetical protein [Desulfobacterales bacterium]